MRRGAAEYSRAGWCCRPAPKRPSGATHSVASSSAMNAFFPATWSLAATKWSMGSDPIVLSRCVRDDWSNSVINANRLPVLVYEKIVRIY